MTSKTIKRRHPAMRDDIADLTTRRPVPGAAIDQVDPFLFLNHHGPQEYAPHNHGLPFGPHPHRGFETVTFILTGELAHLDSAGHESIIKAVSDELSEKIICEEQDLAKRAPLIDQDIAEIVREIGLETTKKVFEKTRDSLVLKKTPRTEDSEESDDKL